MWGLWILCRRAELSLDDGVGNAGGSGDALLGGFPQFFEFFWLEMGWRAGDDALAIRNEELNLLEGVSGEGADLKYCSALFDKIDGLISLRSGPIQQFRQL